MPRWDDRLLKLVNDELQYLWAMGAEFDAQNPDVAPRLRLGNREAQDPFVERLLEGFAFMAARVRLKLEDEFPRFTQSLLETVNPAYLSPMPAMTIVQLAPKFDEGSLIEGYTLKRDTVLLSARSEGENRCTFLTRHETTLWPVAIREARYYGATDLDALDLHGAEWRAAIRITLETRVPGVGFDGLKGLDQLSFYLPAMPRTPVTLYEQLFAHSGRPQVRCGRDEPVILPPIGRVGFEDSEAVLPTEVRSFQGHRLLAEYFAMPQRFLFFRISGLGPALENCTASTCDLVIPLTREERQLETRITAANFALFCTPAINLFPEVIRADVSPGQSEFPLIPRLHPREYEVYRVDEVVATGARQTNGYGAASSPKHREQVFLPFYREADAAPGHGRFFTTARVDNRFERLVPQDMTRDQLISGNPTGYTPGGRNKSQAYRGSDVYVGLVDRDEAPYAPELTSLVAQTLCTNRGLALTIRPGEGATDFKLEAGGAPVQSVRCVDGLLTPPRPSYVDGETCWRMVDYLSANYSSMVNQNEEKNAAALRELLSLYTGSTQPQEDPQVRAVLGLRGTPIRNRVPSPGPIAFAQGVQLQLTLDETAFGDIGVFILGSVLEQFFRKYVSINSFTQTTLITPQRGTVMQWPARLGSRQLL